MSFFDILPTFSESPYSYVFTSLILVNSLIGFYHKSFFYALLLHPYELARGKRLHTLLTSALIHRGPLHLIFNSVVVFTLTYDMFGCIKQEVGLASSLILTPVLLSLLIVIPNLIQVYYKQNWFEFTSLGASGVSFGLYGFSTIFFPLQKINHLFIPWINYSAHYWLYILVIITILSFITAARINRVLHVTAFMIGSLLALMVRNTAIAEFFTSFTALDT